MNAAAHPHWLKPRHLALLVFINLVWGINLLTSKLGVAEIPPIFFATLRVLLLLLVCLPWLRWFPGQMRNLLLVSLYTGVGGFGLLALGLGLSKDVSTVAIFLQLFVPFSVLVSVLVIGERIHWRRTLGIALAFIGVIVIGFDPRAFSYLPGLICIVLQALSAAIGLIYIKRLKGISPMHLQAWVAILSLPVMLALSAVFEHGQWAAVQAASWKAWSAVLVAGIGSSLIGQTSLFYLLKRYPASSVAPLTVLSTLFGMMAGVLVNNDVLTGSMLFGGALTLLGVLIIELRSNVNVVPPDTGR